MLIQRNGQQAHAMRLIQKQPPSSHMYVVENDGEGQQSSSPLRLLRFCLYFGTGGRSKGIKYASDINATSSYGLKMFQIITGIMAA
mmetsp:Transcript_5075/g.5764  ORF Transcript_5075/g.5764 Transcript_5075/m.5764 type:complete len:86 (+) Transcript_5075:2444-2701(+)